MLAMLYTLFSIIAPALVNFVGFSVMGAIVIFRSLFLYSMTGTPSCSILRFLPIATMGTLWFMKHEQSRYIFLLPMICMGLFLVHPVGMLAWGYTLYWLIPIYCTLARSNNLLIRAFSTVLVTHAIGSVIFLYTHDTNTLFWWQLIPQVALERSIGALCVWGAWRYHESDIFIKAHVY